MASMNGGNDEPIHILQVVGGMNPGGTETWLMHVLRKIDRERFKIDFLVHTHESCIYDAEIRSLGSRIISCDAPSKPLGYARRYKQILLEEGPYDIVHSHVQHFSGFVLFLAKRSSVPVRIVHSHLDTQYRDSKAKVKRRAYLRLMEALINKYATCGIAVSQKAGNSLFGHNWGKDSRWQLLHCGIDLKPFNMEVDRKKVRQELEIPDNAFVIGHVGRFDEQKNHLFLIEIFSELTKLDPNAFLLLIGAGPLCAKVEQRVMDLGIVDRVLLAGIRSDVPHLMMGAMDAFVFPSLFEGLPLVGIEVQAACLPFILSDVISVEVDIVNSLIWRLSLSQSAFDWAKTLLAVRAKGSTINKSEALTLIDQSSFNINVGVSELENLYINELQNSKMI